MDYSPIACRILISEKDYSKDTDFITYDPRSKEGPWWHDPETDTHYWNGNICMEVMVETEISICDCLATQFVQHHPNYCCIAPNECPDRKLYHLDAGGLFIAGVVSRNLPTECLHMTVEESGVQQPTDHLRGALGNLLQGYRNQQATGTITAADASAPALARSVLAAYHRRDTAEESALGTLFASADDLQRSVNRLVCAAFGLPVV